MTVQVPPLPAHSIQAALQRGLACAQRLQQQGLITATVLACQGSLLRLPAIQSLESVLV